MNMIYIGLNLANSDTKSGSATATLASVLRSVRNESADIWHQRLGHLNPVYMRQLRDHAVSGISFADNKLSPCEIFTLGKLTKRPFRTNPKRASERLELIHSDLCHVSEPSLGRAKYFLTFLDDFSRKVLVYFIKSKDEVPKGFTHFHKYVENQCIQK